MDRDENELEQKLQTFTDRVGRPWLVTLDVAAFKAVKQSLGLDLFALVEDGARGLADLVSDPVRLVDVLYVLCREQIKDRGMDDVNFGRGFSGDCLERAADAFVAAYIHFFPNAQARKSLQTLIAKGKAVGAKLLEKADQKAAELDIDQLAQQLVETLSDSSGAAPASSALSRDA